MSTITPIIWTYAPKKDKTCAVKIRISIENTKDYIPLKYSVLPDNFNEGSASPVKSTDTRHKEINAEIRRVCGDLQKIMDSRNFYSAEHVKRVYITGKDLKYISKSDTPVFDLMEKDVSRFDPNESYNSYKSYKSIYNFFLSFCGDSRIGDEPPHRKKLRVRDLNKTLFLSYVRYLESFRDKEGNGQMKGTIHKKISKLKAFVNTLIPDYILPQDDPFLRLELPKRGQSNPKPLTNDEIKAIETLVLSRDKFGNTSEYKWAQIAQDTFILRYYVAGMRISDAILLKWTDISDRIAYRTRKSRSEKELDFAILPQVQRILDKYDGADPVYVFGLIKNNGVHPVKQSSAVAASINKGLKDVAKFAGVRSDLSTHMARYTAAKRILETSDIFTASNALGHSDVRTTQKHYLEMTKKAKLDEALRRATEG
jgi:integrase